MYHVKVPPAVLKGCQFKKFVAFSYLHVVNNLLKKAAKGRTLFIKAFYGLHFLKLHSVIHGKTNKARKKSAEKLAEGS